MIEIIDNEENKVNKRGRIIVALMVVVVVNLVFLILGASDKANIVQAAENTEVTAEKLNASISLSSGKSSSGLMDTSYSTKVIFQRGESITIKSTKEIYGIYIEWANIPEKWNLSYSGKTVECGVDGFLHEYVKIDGGLTELTLTLPSGGSICNISAYSDGILPHAYSTRSRANLTTWSRCERKVQSLKFRMLGGY